MASVRPVPRADCYIVFLYIVNINEAACKFFVLVFPHFADRMPKRQPHDSYHGIHTPLSASYSSAIDCLEPMRVNFAATDIS